MCRTQGLDPALVCGAVFSNSFPCVRHGAGRAGACCRAGAPGPGRRALLVLTATGADGRYRRRALRCAATPTRVVDNLHGISAPTRVVDMSARYIPLAVSTTPSQCRQPPRGANNPLAVSSTTPSWCRQRAPAFVLEARPPRACGRCSCPRPFGGSRRAAGCWCRVLEFLWWCVRISRSRAPMLLRWRARTRASGPRAVRRPRVRARGGPFFHGLGAGQCLPGYAHKDP